MRNLLARIVSLFGLAGMLGITPAVWAQSNGVYREVYFNITGSAIANLTNASIYPNTPGFDEVVINFFETPQSLADNYGTRMRSLLTPPVSGNYVFGISSDDNGELWLSTDESPTNKQLVARVPTSGTFRYYTNANQISGPISLVAGQRYYMEALQKEGTGGDFLSVRWQSLNGGLPGLSGQWETSDTNAPIPAIRLVPYGLIAPVIVQPPTNVTVIERGTANFGVRLVRIASTTYQWQRNGASIPGATSSNLAYGPVALSDNGSMITCLISNPAGTVTTTNVTLTVLPDIVAPTISSISSLGDGQLFTLIYSEDVEAISATNRLNYSISGGVTILNIAFGPDSRTLLLTTTPLTQNGNYTLTVNNVRDRAATPNSIAPATQSSFTLAPTPLPITFLKPQPEPIGPSTRRGALVISEVMYHPASRADGKEIEFIEVYNTLPWFEEMGGYKITGAIDYTFPTNFVLGARSFVVIAKVPTDVQAVYGITGVQGPWTGSLQNSSGTLRLRNQQGAVLFEMDYQGDPPYPLAADGAGHSLILARPSFGQDDIRAWGASDLVGGTPGTNEVLAANPYATVMINEFLAHTDLPDIDYIELYNYSTQAVNVGGCALSDDPATNKFIIPTNTIIPAQGFLVYYETNMTFALSASGEEIFFRNPQGTRVIDCLRFDAQENGVAMGRYPDGAPLFSRLQALTPGTNNAPVRTPTVVINEIMYHPVSETNDNEYLELYNPTTNTINLAGWRIEDGVKFTIPSNTVIAPSGYLVIAANAARLRTLYPGLTAANCLGNWSGNLKNSGERVALSMPDDIISVNGSGVATTNTIHIVVDEVTYRTGGRWGTYSAGGGSSLELRNPRTDHRLAPSWGDSDESAKSGWVNVETTGMMTNGWAEVYQLHITLMGPGECLIDNVEVVTAGGVNVVTNGTFESGVDGWVFQGNHNMTGWESGGGYNSAGCLHLRTTGRGDTGANRIRTQIPASTIGTNVVTVRAKVRWLKGSPNILLRLRGNWLEAPGTIIAAANLGTPGAANTAALINAPPAITDVAHWPPLPATNQPVLVTARVTDGDGLFSLFLRYRIDPSPDYVSVAMINNGAGLYSAVIPGQGSNIMAAFYIQAADKLGAVGFFPNDAPNRECVVLWGDTTSYGTLPSYRFWIRQDSYSRWVTEEKMSNKPKDVTFVYGTNRVVYNAGAWFHGSPYHSPGYNTPLGTACDYDMGFPEDDKLLGETDINLFRPGNGGSDATGQSEIHGSWWANILGVPYLFHRSIFVIVNGLRRGTVFYDAQQPNGDHVDQWFPDDADGELHKVQNGFEFGDTAYGSGEAGYAAQGANFNRYYANASGQFQQARYRQTLPLRSVTPWEQNNYTNLFTFVNATMTSAVIGTEAYTIALTNAADVEEWYRVDVLQHLWENTDSFSWGGGQNAFMYKPTHAPWKLLLWDIDFAFGNGSGVGTNINLFNIGSADHGPRNDHAPFRRIYWQALLDAANTVLLSNRSSPIADARYSGLVASGAAVTSPNAIKNFTANKLTFVLSNLATVASPFAITSNNGNDFTNAANVITLSGVAPIDVRTIEINGIAYQPVWSSITNWTITLALGAASNNLAIVGRDRSGAVFSNSTATIRVTVTAPLASPVDNLVFNEIMYNPLISGAEYLELFNRSTNTSFDLSRWRVNGLDYTFPDGAVIGARQYLVLTKDAPAFVAAYGTNVAVSGTYGGNLQANGETLALIKPGATPDLDQVIDKVRYDNAAPWPAAPAGASVDLIDTAQDNSRVGDWAGAFVPAMTNVGWRFISVSATFGGDNRLWVYPDFAGTVYIDDLSLVVTTNGSNYVRNGDFELPLTNGWTVPTNMLASTVVTNFSHSGNSCLQLVATSPGSSSSGGFTRNLIQTLSPSPVPGQPCTLSYWLWATNGAITNVTAAVRVSALGATGNALIQSTAQTNYASPGTNNYSAKTLVAFPTLWINEVLPENVSGLQDSAGERDPWIEFYNSGTNSVSLDGLYLANNYTNLIQWAFPTGVVIGAKQFKVLFADGQTNQTTSSELHTPFRLAGGVGSVALSRLSSGSTQIVDYVNYSASLDHSYGSFPDGQPFDRQEFYYMTPGATNNGTLPPVVVFINEWMADNAALLDPADSDPEDWFELYNPGTNVVSLTGYFLTDALTNKFKYEIPAGYPIPAHGYLLVWADGESTQNSPSRRDLHVNFSLAKAGEEIGLFTPAGLQIDAVTFGGQYTDIARGRFPDGSGTIIFLTNATPRAANFFPLPNTAPRVVTILDQSVIEGAVLSFTATATDSDAPAQQFSWSLGAGAPINAVLDPGTGTFSWQPGESDGGNIFVVPVIVTDNGNPSLSATQLVNITVIETNSAPHIAAVSSRTISEGSQITFTVTATDPDIPAQNLAFSLDPGSPDGASINPSNGVFSWTPAEDQGPGSYILTIRVRDDGVPALEDSVQVTITVNEVNQRPSLAAFTPRTVVFGETVSLTASATDADLPTQHLVFDLSSAPAGATINATNGSFSWTANLVGTNLVLVRVIDDAPSPLADVKPLTIIVTPELWQNPVTLSNGVVRLAWPSIIGRSYRVDYKTNLDETNWTSIGSAISATNTVTELTDLIGTNSRRVYRIVLLP